MKTSITIKLRHIVIIALIFLIARASVLTVNSLYLDWVANTSVECCGGSMYGREADSLRRKIRGNCISEFFNFYSWTPSSMVKDAVAYNLAKSKIREYDELTIEKLKNTEPK